MTDQQLIVLIAFSAVIIGLSLLMMPRSPRLNGRQKHSAASKRSLDAIEQHVSISPVHAAFAALFGIGLSRDTRGGGDADATGSFDAGFGGGDSDGGGGDGGGD